MTVNNTSPIAVDPAEARTAEARDAFVGIDDRAAGETAAFLVGRMLGDRTTAVGFVLGDRAHRCREDRDIGFRSTLRTHFPKVLLAAEAIGQDNAPTTYLAARNMLESHPGIGAIYSVAGGHAGMVKARDWRTSTSSPRSICRPTRDEPGRCGDRWPFRQEPGSMQHFHAAASVVTWRETKRALLDS